jgi:hypothetical protein
MTKRGNKEHPLRRNFVGWPDSLIKDYHPPALPLWALENIQDDEAEGAALTALLRTLNDLATDEETLPRPRSPGVCMYCLKVYVRKQDLDANLPPEMSARSENYVNHQKRCTREIAQDPPN